VAGERPHSRRYGADRADRAVHGNSRFQFLNDAFAGGEVVLIANPALVFEGGDAVALGEGF